MEKGFYWIRYNSEGWTIGEYDADSELWMIPGDEVCKEQGWIDEVGEKIVREEKVDTGDSNCTLCDVINWVAVTERLPPRSDEDVEEFTKRVCGQFYEFDVIKKRKLLIEFLTWFAGNDEISNINDLNEIVDIYLSFDKDEAKPCKLKNKF